MQHDGRPSLFKKALTPFLTTGYESQTKVNYGNIRQVTRLSQSESDDLGSLLDTGKYSDLTLHCHEKTWKVHRALVCTSSRVFAAMVDTGFKEGQNHEIDLPDDEPEIVEKMLRFLYQGDYDDERNIDVPHSEDLASAIEEKAALALPISDEPPATNTSLWNASIQGSFEPIQIPTWSVTSPVQEPDKVAEISTWSEKSLLINVKAYIIADKNDIGALKKRATKKYAEAVGRLWDTPSFPVSVKLLYDNTPQSDRLLRDVVAESAKRHIMTLINKEDFERVMVSHGDLAVDVLKSVLPKREEVDSDPLGWKKKKKKNF